MACHCCCRGNRQGVEAGSTLWKIDASTGATVWWRSRRDISTCLFVNSTDGLIGEGGSPIGSVGRSQCRLYSNLSVPIVEFNCDAVNLVGVTSMASVYVGAGNEFFAGGDATLWKFDSSGAFSDSTSLAASEVPKFLYDDASGGFNMHGGFSLSNYTSSLTAGTSVSHEHACTEGYLRSATSYVSSEFISATQVKFKRLNQSLTQLDTVTDSSALNSTGDGVRAASATSFASIMDGGTALSLRDSSTMSETWRVTPTGLNGTLTFPGAAEVDVNDNVYIVTSGPVTIRQRDAADGAENWTWAPGGAVTQLIHSGSLLYVSGNLSISGSPYGIAAITDSSGSVSWKHQTGGQRVERFEVTGGYIYAVTGIGKPSFV